MSKDKRKQQMRGAVRTGVEEIPIEDVPDVPVSAELVQEMRAKLAERQRERLGQPLNADRPANPSEQSGTGETK